MKNEDEEEASVGYLVGLMAWQLLLSYLIA